MTITGTVTAVLPIEVGQKKDGGQWQKQDVIIQTEGEYPKQIAFTVWGTTIPIPRIGDDVTANIDIESREYNGKYYTNVKAYKLITTQAAHNPTPVAVDLTGDLPF